MQLNHCGRLNVVCFNHHHRLNDIDNSQEGGSARFTQLAPKEVIKTWHAAGDVAPPAPHASALAIDYLSFFTSDMFAEMSDSCCKTLFFPPGASARLPFDMDMDGEYVQRLRNFVGNRNTLLFNGADSKIIEFINHYFGYKIKQVRTSVRISPGPAQATDAEGRSECGTPSSTLPLPRSPLCRGSDAARDWRRRPRARRNRVLRGLWGAHGGLGRCRWCLASSGASRSWCWATPPPRPPSPRPTPSKSGCAPPSPPTRRASLPCETVRLARCDFRPGATLSAAFALEGRVRRRRCRENPSRRARVAALEAAPRLRARAAFPATAAASGRDGPRLRARAQRGWVGSSRRRQLGRGVFRVGREGGGGI